MKNKNYSERLAMAAAQHYLEKEYWLSQLSGEWLKGHFPDDYDRNQADPGGHDLPEAAKPVTFRFPKELYARLRWLSNDSDYALNVYLVTGLALLLSKYTGGQDRDVMVGTPIYRQDLEGEFVNTVLPLRIRPRDEMTFKELLLQVKETIAQATENQCYPVEVLVDQLNLSMSEKEFPLFDTAILLENLHHKDYLRHIYRGMTFSFAKTPESIAGSIEYDPTRYRVITIESIATNYIGLFRSLLFDLDKKIFLPEILAEEEKRRLLWDFNRTEVPYPAEKTLHQLFTRQVRRSPDHVSLVGTKLLREEHLQSQQSQPPEISKRSHQFGIIEPLISVTYKELNKRSNQLAHRLAEGGAKAETIVGIMLERSLDMIAGIMAILKTGAAYLPISPGYPPKRKTYLIKDSGISILLTQKAKNLTIPAENINVLDIGDRNSNGSAVDTATFTFMGQPTKAAYVMYTSGSAGKPKGVIINHGSAVNVVTWFARSYELHGRSHVLQMSDYTFDPSVNQIFGTLLHGAALYLVSKELLFHIPALRQLIKTWQIHLLNFVPSLLNDLLAGEKIEDLRFVLSGGEKLDDTVKNRILARGYRLINQYGPTETTIDALVSTCSHAKVTLGRPIANTRCYILDKHHLLVPLGAVGELCISGAGVARGYLNNPELTNSKFINWKLQNTNQEKPCRQITTRRGETTPTPNTNILYQTGDMARWLPEGQVQFLGRIDHQVKVRGFRVELGEIESQLLRHRDLEHAVVRARESSDRQKSLCAYIVRKAGNSLSPSELKAYLQETLPDYMIPTHFVTLDRLPLTPGGKIDNNALPPPETRLSSANSYSPPRNDIEKRLVAIWAEILGMKKEQVSIHDNFFELGGHSLNATIMATKISREFNTHVPLVEIFDTPHISALAKFLKNKTGTVEQAGNYPKNLVLLKENPREDNHFFFLHDGGGEVEGYIEFCHHREIGFNCWGIRANRLEAHYPLKITIEELAEQYIDMIDTIQTQGPYYIAGWSLGGTIAFEMARQMEQAGREIALLAIIDTPPPPACSTGKNPGFTLESEREFIIQHLSGSEFENQLLKLTDLKKTWDFTVDYLESIRFDSQTLKKVIREYEAHVVPNDHQLDIRALVRYINTGRTFRQARLSYIPPGKLNTPGHFFKASDSGVEPQPWNAYFKKPLQYHEIEATHYSILHAPHLTHVITILNRIIKEAKHTPNKTMTKS
jgi:amino acid adenylation domain-containing protein